MLNHHSLISGLAVVVVIATLAGCSDRSASPLEPTWDFQIFPSRGVAIDPPTGVVDVTAGEETLSLFPYTGNDFSGNPVDPINIVFVGNVDATTIRNALMALDGDRTGAGFPPVAPFNGTWSDALGGVQTTYADGAGWVGSVVQLNLGGYGPVRVHLRLFETRQPYDDGGKWTLGGAHFEVLIPGTTDHQVLGWELAELIVVSDLVRSGLVVATSSSGVINAAPSFRTIPAMIYNGIPDELKLLAGLPVGPSTTDVPIPSDGEATVLQIEGEVSSIADSREASFTLQFSQIIPKPFCSDSPFDYLLVEGPVSLRKVVRISAQGSYAYDAAIRGQLTATPVDVTQNPPVPAGEPFKVTASDVQHGFISASDARVSMQGKRIIIGNGAEKQFTRLEVHERGTNDFRVDVKCLQD
jgi:hypothetical protein